MLTVLTTDSFADWFSALEEDAAEDVATTIELIERSEPTTVAAGSRESLLWYEYTDGLEEASTLMGPLRLFGGHIEEWCAYLDYARRVVRALEGKRFRARLASLGSTDATKVLAIVKEIERLTGPRLRISVISGSAAALSAQEDLRRLYFEALAIAGIDVSDPLADPRALREVARRNAREPYRLLYGVDVSRGAALFVLGESLDRRFYGDSVRRAERSWRDYLTGSLATTVPHQGR